MLPDSVSVGEIIVSRPYDEEGVGMTPTGIVTVNEARNPWRGQSCRLGALKGSRPHFSGGTFESMYNPILVICR